MSYRWVSILTQSVFVVRKWQLLRLKYISLLAVVFTVGFPISGDIRGVKPINIVAGFPGSGIRESVTSFPGIYPAGKTDPLGWVYYTQSGDTLQAVALRFQVRLAEIVVPQSVTADQLIDPGLLLIIPRPVMTSPSMKHILPDNEVVYSPSAEGFDTLDYVSKAGGYLGTYHEYLRSTGTTSAAEIVERVALENSINPRLLLALLEYQCRCVAGPLEVDVDPDFLMGVDDPLRKGLYRQLGWVVNQLSLGYYGWRRGLLTDLVFTDSSPVELPPDLNAGSVSLAYLFSLLHDRVHWDKAMNTNEGFAALYTRMFNDQSAKVQNPDPLFPTRLAQPHFVLPFQPGDEWGFTSGPHSAWETEGALAALDFAPASDQYGCLQSNAWVVAVADGLVVRSEHGAVVLDLDGDGIEGTGWAVLYMHLESRGRVAPGTFLRRGDPVGHPSCEGGPADGTHVHIARKYNGEWIAADGPLSFEMSGWVTRAGYRPFEGSLTRGNKTVVANSLSPAGAFINRSVEELLMYAENPHDRRWEE
jgi:LasA protease